MKVIASLIIFITVALSITTLSLAATRSRFLLTGKEKLVLPKQHSSSIVHLCKIKDDKLCKLFKGKDAICCQDKCVESDNDFNNCGACNNMCLATEACCGGKCVDVKSDSKNCGACNNECMSDTFCAYGMCDYP